MSRGNGRFGRMSDSDGTARRSTVVRTWRFKERCQAPDEGRINEGNS
jgi:hypothetical protein